MFVEKSEVINCRRFQRHARDILVQNKSLSEEEIKQLKTSLRYIKSRFNAIDIEKKDCDESDEKKNKEVGLKELESLETLFRVAKSDTSHLSCSKEKIQEETGLTNIQNIKLKNSKETKNSTTETTSAERIQGLLQKQKVTIMITMTMGEFMCIATNAFILIVLYYY